MELSKKEKILKSRLEFSSVFDCFSLKEENDNYELDTCQCCEENTDCVTMIFLKRSDIKNKNFKEVYEEKMCNGCIISMLYSDDSDLDY